MKTRTKNTLSLYKITGVIKNNQYAFDIFKLISNWETKNGLLQFLQFFNTELVSLFLISGSTFSTSVSAEVFTAVKKSRHCCSQSKRQSAKSTQFLGFHNEIIVLEKPCGHVLVTEIFKLNTRIIL